MSALPRERAAQQGARAACSISLSHPPPQYPRPSPPWRAVTIFKPFGYSKYPTALMIAAFWSFFVVACGTHYWQYWQNKKAKLAQGASADEPVKSVATA